MRCEHGIVRELAYCGKCEWTRAEAALIQVRDLSERIVELSRGGDSTHGTCIEREMRQAERIAEMEAERKTYLASRDVQSPEVVIVTKDLWTSVSERIVELEEVKDDWFKRNTELLVENVRLREALGNLVSLHCAKIEQPEIDWAAAWIKAGLIISKSRQETQVTPAGEGSARGLTGEGFAASENPGSSPGRAPASTTVQESKAGALLTPSPDSGAGTADSQPAQSTVQETSAKIPEIAPCLFFEDQEECPAMKELRELRVQAAQDYRGGDLPTPCSCDESPGRCPAHSVQERKSEPVCPRCGAPLTLTKFGPDCISCSNGATEPETTETKMKRTFEANQKIKQQAELPVCEKHQRRRNSKGECFDCAMSGEDTNDG